MPDLIEACASLCLAVTAAFPFTKCATVTDAAHIFLELQEYERIGIVVCLYLSTKALVRIVRGCLAKIWSPHDANNTLRDSRSHVAISQYKHKPKRPAAKLAEGPTNAR
jgi:hypothetical protein